MKCLVPECVPGVLCWCVMLFMMVCSAQEGFQKDTIETSAGDLEVTFIGHGTLMFTIGENVVHIDPWAELADYKKLPKANLVLVTHDHSDHLDATAIKEIAKENTKVIITELCAGKVEDGVVMKNGDTTTLVGMEIMAVPAYNIEHKRPDGKPFHSKGEGNGYVLTIGDKRIYIAGDTENTVEMKALENIDIAFLPMNLPYTMTPEMVVDAVLAFKPGVLYPYHFGDTNTDELVTLLKDHPEIEVRIRNLK